MRVNNGGACLKQNVPAKTQVVTVQVLIWHFGHKVGLSQRVEGFYKDTPSNKFLTLNSVRAGVVTEKHCRKRRKWLTSVYRK